MGSLSVRRGFYKNFKKNLTKGEGCGIFRINRDWKNSKVELRRNMSRPNVGTKYAHYVHEIK